MSENTFFKPTVLYKEYMILDMIEKNAHVTQREISQEIGIAVSMVNSYLDEYEKDKLIIRKKHSTKTVEYFVTNKGSERRKLLNIGYLNASQKLYNSAKENIDLFLLQIEKKGFSKILLYGAGEVAELFLGTINIQTNSPIKVLAIVDDNVNKHDSLFMNHKVISLNDIFNYPFDGILISSYTNRRKILSKLLDIKVETNKIIHFFD